MTAAGTGPSGAAERPPLWLVAATAAMAFVLLAMSVGETSLKGQYLIDQGESLSLAGLAFILIAGLYLHRRGRLAASLPLVFPWLLYPVITQGDQIIDNLSITWMRIIVHILLAAIFATPVAVAVFAARWAFSLTPARARHLALLLLVLEFWLAYAFLGVLMILTLGVMVGLVVKFGNREPGAGNQNGALDGRRLPGWRTRVALWLLVGGVMASGGLYLGFKNRPGAYQGSPSFYMDPAQPGGAFNLAAIAVPAGSVASPPNAGDIRRALTTYGDSLQKLLDGYYILDRNYNFHFHNELFVRSDALLPNYRTAGLTAIREGAALRANADAVASDARARLAAADPLAALLDDVRAYAAFSFGRADTLERMSAEFETTKAGLQHATHIYEGEGKYLGVQLAGLLAKHQAALSAPAAAPVVSDFVAKSRAIHDRYANRIVGF